MRGINKAALFLLWAAMRGRPCREVRQGTEVLESDTFYGTRRREILRFSCDADIRYHGLNNSHTGRSEWDGRLFAVTTVRVSVTAGTSGGVRVKRIQNCAITGVFGIWRGTECHQDERLGWKRTGAMSTLIMPQTNLSDRERDKNRARRRSWEIVRLLLNKAMHVASGNHGS
ncbi:hypothetical protein B0T16DRAFT_152297 [Cercophora newfieldiana]|uniref:Secreted protein n=1 Tax=Cercophora newfieldiana TaxID=92897 RepID=A0AA39Y7R9_9PEZI|nr:hypothetical protein B0T16DRAFT_152297 [Cercophora newfieldiana]